LSISPLRVDIPIQTDFVNLNMGYYPTLLLFFKHPVDIPFIKMPINPILITGILLVKKQ